jgi:hypothetical protein
MTSLETESKLSEINEIVNEVFNYVKNQAELAKFPLSNSLQGDANATERGIFKRVLEIGKKLMEYYFEELGVFDLGREIEVEGKRFTRKVCSPATLLTVFGVIKFLRYCYYSDNAETIKPMDMKANLPARQASYFVQDLLSRFGIKYTTYDEAKNFFKDLFGHGFSKHTLEEIVLETASHYPDYEGKNPLPDKESEGKLCAVQADGKGVRVLPGENPDSSGKTKEALVGAVYTVNPHIRGAEEVACSLTTPKLLTQEQRETLRNRDRARNIHYQASIQRSKEEVFKSLQDEVNQRIGESQRPICLFDGAHILWDLGEKYFPNAIYILDIIHVLDYLWDAVHVFKQKDTKRAKALANLYLTMILEGKVGYVIGALRQRLSKRKFGKEKRKIVEKAITYYENHREYMRYDEYLAKGYPIGTGVVESACGHLVKDRMQKSGARWKIVGAEPVLNLRSVYANGDWKVYQDLRMQEEYNRLYPHLLAA